MTTKFIGVKELRQNMARVAYAARKHNQRLIVLKKNEPIFELRPLTKEMIERVAEELSGAAVAAKRLQEEFIPTLAQKRALRRAERNLAAGKTLTYDDVAKQLGITP